MKPLTKAQIAEMTALLAPHGLVVKPAPKPRSDKLARLKAWKPETPAGRACKSNMLWLASLPPIQGAGTVRLGLLCPIKHPKAIADWYAGKWSELPALTVPLLTCNKRRQIARAKLEGYYA